MRYGICFLYCFELAPCFNLRGVFFFTALETNCINVLCFLIGSIDVRDFYRIAFPCNVNLSPDSSLLSILRSGLNRRLPISMFADSNS